MSGLPWVVNGGGGFVVCQWRWFGLILWCLFGISQWLQWFWIDLDFRWLWVVLGFRWLIMDNFVVACVELGKKESWGKSEKN